MAQESLHYAADHGVLPPRQVRMHPGVEVEEAHGRRRGLDRTLVRLHHAAKQAQQRRFPRAVAADDAEHLALGELEAYPAQPPEILSRPPSPALLKVAAEGPRRIRVADPKPFAEPAHGESRHSDLLEEVKARRSEIAKRECKERAGGRENESECRPIGPGAAQQDRAVGVEQMDRRVEQEDLPDRLG